MANEAKVFAEGPANCIVRQFTVADGTAVPKGTLLVENGDRTGIAHTAAGLASPLGYTTMSKEASDGITEVGCQRTGVVLAYVDGNYRTGQVAIAGATTANRVQVLPGNVSLYTDVGLIVGRFLDSGSDGTQARVALTLG